MESAIMFFVGVPMLIILLVVCVAAFVGELKRIKFEESVATAVLEMKDELTRDAPDR